MADLTYIPDHEDRAVSRLPSRLRQPVITALVQTIAAEIQNLEDDVVDLLSGLPVEVARGVVLDRWGAIVGEPRLGLDDPTLRRVIQAKLLASQASSRREYIVRFVTELFEEEEVTYSEYLTAFRVNVTSNRLISASLGRRVLRLLALATPAGVSSSIAEGSLDVFRFNRDPGFGKKFGRILR